MEIEGNVMAAAKSSRVNRKYKTKYRIRNWSEYERGLKNRGDVMRPMFWRIGQLVHGPSGVSGTSLRAGSAEREPRNPYLRYLRPC